MKIIVAIVVAFILIKEFFKRYKPMIKGDIGEMKVKFRLKFLPKEYKIINDVMLANDKGKTVQIDHIVVGSNGIFVIETKNYTGTICGGLDEVSWKQIFQKSSHDFYNPLFQNKGHIIELRNQLKGLGYIPIYSVIAFGENCNLMLPDSITNVMYMNEVKNYIKAYESDTILSDKNIENITNLIKKNNIRSFRNKRKHRIYVKQTYK